MERALGRTGLRVFPIGMGAMPLSLQGRPDERTAIGVLHAALDAGVTLLDTADSYCVDDRDTGHNERLIAKALAAYPKGRRAVVATKGGMTRPRGAWNTDGRPEHLRRACERSLKALGVESITLYQFHWPDPAVPYGESVGALARLQEEGKIQHVGISNVAMAQLNEAQSIVRVESVQNRCNPFDQGDLRNGVLQACARQGVSYIAYSPVGGHSGHGRQAGHPVLKSLAQAHHTSPYCVALAWLLSLGPHVLPIPGASRASSIRDSVQAVDVKLAPADLRQLAALG